MLEHSAYHHGEQSLASNIIGLAQNFVGSNNINLLFPHGQRSIWHPWLGKIFMTKFRYPDSTGPSYSSIVGVQQYVPVFNLILCYHFIHLCQQQLSMKASNKHSKLTFVTNISITSCIFLWCTWFSSVT
jgi:hypothetical protein